MDPILLIGAAVCVPGIMCVVFFAMLTRAYVKVPPGRALVRAGGFFRSHDSPPRVVINGGAWVFEFIHEAVLVDLSTLAIEIERIGQDALSTCDSQRVGIKAVFYVHVNPTVKSIIDAARSFGGKAVGADIIKPFVIPKLHSALRKAVAALTLANLQEAELLTQQVLNGANSDLENHGVSLESLSIIKLEAA